VRLYSSGLDNRVKQITDGLVLTDNGGFDAVDLALLLPDFLFKFGQLVLQRLDHFFGQFLLLFQLLRARDTLLSPVLILLTHTVHIVSHEVDRLAQWQRALAQNLDGFLKELNVILIEATASWARVDTRICRAADLLRISFTFSFARISCSSLLLLSNAAHLDLRSRIFATLLRWQVIVVSSHQLLCLLNHGTVVAFVVAAELIVHGSRALVAAIHHHVLLIIFALITISEQLLPIFFLLLLSRHLLLLLETLLLKFILFHFALSSLLLLHLNSLTFFLLAAAFLFLFLLALCFCRCGRFSFSFGLLSSSFFFSLCLSHRLCLSFILPIVSFSLLTIV
jgi:hypothetical protein